MRRNEYRRIFPGTSSRQRRSALDVHGGWSSGWRPSVVVLLSVVTVVRQHLLPFFLSFSHLPHGSFSSAKTETEKSAKLDAGTGRDASSRLPSMRIVQTDCGWLGYTPMSPLKRLSSLGCCEASGTPVTDCLAPEHAPALALTGAHEKKRGTCRADFPRVSCPRCHGPSVPHSSTVPNNSRTFRIPPIVSTFLLLVKEERVCLASTRSSLVDCRQKTMARPPPSCF